MKVKEIGNNKINKIKYKIKLNILIGQNVFKYFWEHELLKSYKNYQIKIKRF